MSNRDEDTHSLQKSFNNVAALMPLLFDLQQHSNFKFHVTTSTDSAASNIHIETNIPFQPQLEDWDPETLELYVFPNGKIQVYYGTKDAGDGGIEDLHRTFAKDANVRAVDFIKKKAISAGLAK